MVRGLRDVLLDVIITINAMIFQRVSRYDNSVCTLLLQASVSIFDETAYFFFLPVAAVPHEGSVTRKWLWAGSVEAEGC